MDKVSKSLPLSSSGIHGKTRICWTNTTTWRSVDPWSSSNSQSQSNKDFFSSWKSYQAKFLDMNLWCMGYVYIYLWLSTTFSFWRELIIFSDNRTSLWLFRFASVFGFFVLLYFLLKCIVGYKERPNLNTILGWQSTTVGVIFEGKTRLITMKFTLHLKNLHAWDKRIIPIHMKIMRK